MATLILTIQILSTIIGVNSQCSTTYSTYCVSGLEPSDYGSFIGARYESKGTNEGCSYFENVQMPSDSDTTVYLHWDDSDNEWIIGDNLYNTDRWAYCSYSSLDSCTLGNWYRYTGSSTPRDYSMSIGPCNYDNTACITSYNNTFGKSKHNDEDFCIRNTRHRTVNVVIAGSFSVAGCYEEKPYYTINDGTGMSNYPGSVITLAWDNDMGLWQMNYEADTVPWHPIAYCTFNDLNSCSRNWYIWDGSDETQDSLVISGLCNTCTDTNHQKFCIYGGLGRGRWDEIIGIYEYDKCVELMHSYKHTKYDDYYSDNTTFGGDLTLHYFASGNSWRIDVDYDTNLTIGFCDEIDDVMDCTGNWSVFDPIDAIREVNPSVESGSCDIIYDQCFNLVSDDNEQYVCITQHDNDAAVINNEFYYSMIAGEFKYLECDDEGFPIYVRHKDVYGNKINETWHNHTMITYASSMNIFAVHIYNKTLTTSAKGHYLFCRALLLDKCDTFWNLFHNDIDPSEWINEPSIRITKNKCKYPKEDASFIDMIIDNWIYLVIGLAVIFCCCICCLFYICKRKDPKDQIAPNAYDNNKNRNNVNNRAPQYSYDNIRTATPQTPQTPYGKTNTYTTPKQVHQVHQVIPSSSVAAVKRQPQQVVVIQTIAANNTYAYNKPKQSISYKQKKKESFAEPPPPQYNANYDIHTKDKPTPQYNNNTMEMGYIKNNNVDNEFGEGQVFGHVTYGDNDAALDVIVNKDNNYNEMNKIKNENQNKNEQQSNIVNWNKNDILEWINSISLSQQWKENVVNAVKNGQYDGNDLMDVKSGKDIAKLFGIENPMLCSRLWKELKKVK